MQMVRVLFEIVVDCDGLFRDLVKVMVEYGVPKGIAYKYALEIVDKIKKNKMVFVADSTYQYHYSKSI